MLYEFGETTRRIGLDERDASKVTAGVVTLGELAGCDLGRLGLDETCIEECRHPGSRFRTAIEANDERVFVVLSLRNISDVYRERDRAGLLIAKNLFLLIAIADENDSVAATLDVAIRRVHTGTVSLEQLVCYFFEQLLSRDGSSLEEYEEHVDRLEEQVERGATDRGFNAEILALRRKLLVVRHYYEQLFELAETLAADEGELFRPDRLHYFRNLRDRVGRLSSNTQLLRDGLVQVREAYQASLDYGANRIMKVFTVVTTVFLPLTLIVGWYGMNFTTMPELTWKYGYIAVILLSVAVVIACLAFFKRKKLL